MEQLTRQELFNLVWATPISKLCARFGISGVALAKTCARFDIPRPGRGYWQQLASGLKPRKPKLPSSKAPGPIVFDGTPRPLEDRSTESPSVVLRTELRDLHPAVRWLQEAMASAKTDDQGRLLVGGYTLVFCARASHSKRALLVLDAVVKALVSRGTEVAAAPRSEHLKDQTIVLGTGDTTLALGIEEKLRATPHVPTPEEKAHTARWGWNRHRKYDHAPEGELKLRLDHASYRFKGQKSWSDTRIQKLDAQLGRAVLGIEAALAFHRAEHEERQRVAALELQERRRRLRGERLRWYGKMLADELEDTVERWDRARGLREFLDEYDARLPVPFRTSGAEEWLLAAREYVEALDPFNEPGTIARNVAPSDEELEQLIEEDRARAAKDAQAR